MRDAFVNEDFRHATMDGDHSDTYLHVNLDFDFTERVFSYHFYTFLDILATLGGLNASIGPLLRLFGPLFVFAFLWNLSTIIRDHLKANYIAEVDKFINIAKE